MNDNMNRHNNNHEENNNHSDFNSRRLSVSNLLRGNGLEDVNPLRTQEFLKLICSEELYEFSLNFVGIDSGKINLENHLSHQNIQLAASSLRNIKRILQSNNPEEEVELLLHSYNFYKSIPVQKYPTNRNSFSNNTSPQVDPPDTIASFDQLEAKMRLLQAFISISFAISLIRSVKVQLSAEDKLYHAVINEMRCTLTPVERLSMEHDLLFRYFEASNYQKQFNIIDVFTIENEFSIQPPRGSSESIDSNHKIWILLWRSSLFFVLELTIEGCPLYKVLATMRHGLDDTSWNNTIETCQAFKLYDMSFPCLEFHHYNKYALLLYEVFLGIPWETPLIQKTIVPQYDSLVVRGTVGPDPGSATILPGKNTVIPLGSIVSFQDGKDGIYMKHPIPTKYFVYKREQVRVKYLVICEKAK